MTAIIVTYNSADDIRACLESLAADGVQALVIDNGSTDRTLEIVRQLKSPVTVLELPKELGNYAYAINIGMAEVEDEVVVAANADTVFPQGSVEALCAYVAQNPGVGLAGPQLLYPDGGWQCSANHLPSLAYGLKKFVGWTACQQWRQARRWNRGRDREPRVVGYVVGAVMAIRRRAFQVIGGFDADFSFYAEESDFCLRLRQAGWVAVTVPAVTVVHVGGASSTRRDTSGKYIRKLIEARMSLARKHLPPWKVARYAQLEQWHAVVRYLACASLCHLGPRRCRDKLREFAAFYRVAAQTWREQRAGAPCPPLQTPCQ